MNSKFRVWDEKYNCWDTYPIVMYPDEPFIKQGRIIQWFTGLKDRRGNDIYEGDIVNTIYVNDPYNNIGEVIFHHETASFKIKSNSKLLPIVTFRFVDNKPTELLLVANEVVGNIFQPPCHKPNNFDHNGECLICDGWITDCKFKK